MRGRSCIPCVGEGVLGCTIVGSGSFMHFGTRFPILEDDIVQLAVGEGGRHFDIIGSITASVRLYLRRTNCHGWHIRSSCGDIMVDDGTAVRTTEVDIELMSGLTISHDTRDDQRHILLIVALNGINLGDGRSSIHIRSKCTVLVGITDDSGERSGCVIAIWQRRPSERLDTDSRNRFRVIGISGRCIGSYQRVFKIDCQHMVGVIQRLVSYYARV